MTTFLWVLAAFFCGSLPFSVWVGRLALGKDIRHYGDHNPGATNVARAGGGKGWTAVAIILDFLKGALPVGLANFGGQLEGGALAAVAIAPILGHAFSPFLGFRGGKALAVTFGIWSGLTLWLVPTALGGFFALWLWLFKRDGLAVLLGLVSVLVMLLWLEARPAWLMAWAGTTLILAWKHRANFGLR